MQTKLTLCNMYNNSGETTSRKEFREFRSPSNSMEFQGILTKIPWNNVVLRNSEEKELVGIPLHKEFYGISGIEFCCTRNFVEFQGKNYVAQGIPWKFREFR